MRCTLVLICLGLATPVFAETPGLTLRGDARMGLAWSSQPEWAGQRETGLRLTNRARLHVAFSGQTDGGLRFGAEVTLDTDRERARLRSLSIGE